MRLLIVVQVVVIRSYGDHGTVILSNTTYGETEFHMWSPLFDYMFTLELRDLCAHTYVRHQHTLGQLCG